MIPESSQGHSTPTVKAFVMLSEAKAESKHLRLLLARNAPMYSPTRPPTESLSFDRSPQGGLEKPAVVFGSFRRQTAITPDWRRLSNKSRVPQVSLLRPGKAIANTFLDLF
jgi:hypothetical protein